MRVSLEATDGDPVTFPDRTATTALAGTCASKLAFARGQHACPGIHVSRLEAQALVASVLAGCPASAWTRHGAEGRRNHILRRPEAVWAI